VFVGSIAIATVAAAADDGKADGKALKVGNADVTMSGGFRTEWAHTTNGLGKVDTGGKDSKSSAFGVEYMKVKFGGKLNSDVDFKFQLNLLNSKWSYGNPADLVDAAEGTWWASKMFGFTMGKSRVNQDGWNGKDGGGVANIWGKSPYVTPFKTYSHGLSVHMNPGDAGKVTLQLMNDITTKSGPVLQTSIDGKSGTNTSNRPGTWNQTSKQPAAIIEYTGEFGPISPILQVGQYDMNHSRFVDVGARFAMSDLSVTFDYLMDNYSQKVAKASGDGFESKNLTFTDISLRTEYTMKGLAKPFLWVNSYTRSNEKDSVAADDVKANTNPTGNVACSAVKACFDDNAMSLSVGSYILAMGDGWSPYVVYRSVSGKFFKAASADTATGSNNTIAIGAIGSF